MVRGARVCVCARERGGGGRAHLQTNRFTFHLGNCPLMLVII